MTDRLRRHAEILRLFAAMHHTIVATQQRTRSMLGDVGVVHASEEQTIFERRLDAFQAEWSACNAEIAVLIAELEELLGDRPEPDAWEP